MVSCGKYLTTKEINLAERVGHRSDEPPPRPNRCRSTFSRLRYTNVYGVIRWRFLIIPRTAKVFMTNRSQAVRLPKEFQFDSDEVFIRKEGEDVILSPRPTDWSSYLDTGPVASDSFMENIEDLPAQERER